MTRWALLDCYSIDIRDAFDPIGATKPGELSGFARVVTAENEEEALLQAPSAGWYVAIKLPLLPKPKHVKFSAKVSLD